MYDAVGTTFLSQDTKKFCLNKRSKEVSNPNTWSFWGGKVERGETVIGALKREIQEEIGFVPKIVKIHPLDIYQSIDGHFMYHTFVIVTPTEFEPNINYESQDYSWSEINKLPAPLHQGAKKTLLDKNNVKKLQLIVNSIS
jgi:8-oxo-dGTP diphosphatase